MHDARKEGVGTHLVRAEDKATGAVDGAAGHAVASLLFHGQGLAGDHGFVHRGGAFLDHAVHRHARAGTDPQPVAGMHLGKGDLGLGDTVETDGGGRGEIEEGLDGAGGLGAGAELQHLADQDQHDDDGGGLEVDVHHTVGPHRGREKLGQEKPDQAVEPRGTHTERDQREHVPVAGAQGLGAAHKERPSRPEDDRGGEEELRPSAEGRIRQMGQRGREMRHAEQEDRQGERAADPKPAGHVVEFGILLPGLAGAHRFWFKRHATDRAVAGMILFDLRVHRAGVDGRARRRCDPGGITLERHAALGTVAGMVTHDALAHRAVVFRCRR